MWKRLNFFKLVSFHMSCKSPGRRKKSIRTVERGIFLTNVANLLIHTESFRTNLEDLILLVNRFDYESDMVTSSR